MKKLVLSIAVLMMSFGMLMAQGESFQSFYSKNADNPEFTKVAINQKMFKMMGDLVLGESVEDKEVKELIRNLDGFKMLAADGNVGQKYYPQLKKQFSKGYEELMTVKDGDDDMLFLIKEREGKVAELIMLIGGKDKFIAMSLYGDIDLKKVAKLAKKMNIDGMDYLQNIDDN